MSYAVWSIGFRVFCGEGLGITNRDRGYREELFIVEDLNLRADDLYEIAFQSVKKRINATSIDPVRAEFIGYGEIYKQ